MKMRSVPILLAVLLLAGCATAPKDTLYQTSTIDALLAGVYDGDLACGALLAHGDFGIGTFDKLDGEMIVLDGVVRQVKSDGRVYRPSLATPTPFAAVCRFRPDQTVSLKATCDFKALESRLDAAAANSNLFQAVRVKGTFAVMRTRSVPPQTPPYRPLKTVTANQPEFTMTNVTGTIVGFRCPPFVTGLNVPGWHLHFLSADETRGGHILGFELTEGVAELDTLSRFFLRLPEGHAGFAGTDLSRNRSQELHAVER